MKSSVFRFVLLVLGWAAVATVAGALHLMAHLPGAAVPLIIMSLVGAFAFALGRVAWMREGAGVLGIRTIIAAHLIRFVGIYFLWLQSQGRLPMEFAQRAGWGDIIAAGGALVLLFWPEGKSFGRALFWWNLFGAVDLLVAVGTAGWLNLTRPGSMIELSGLPLSLVPLWLVPVLLNSHIYMLRQQQKSVLAG